MKPTSEPYRLFVLGAPEVLAPDGSRVSSLLAQPKRLCLLTYLALAPDPVARSTVMALFWPESDEARARNALDQAVFYLRRSLSKNVVEAVDGGRLWAPHDRLWCDARELMVGEAPGRELVAAARRDVMEGWNADDSQPLQEWLDGLRRRVTARGQELEDADPAGEEGPPLQGPQLAGAAHAGGNAWAGSEPNDEKEKGARLPSRVPWLGGGIAVVTVMVLMWAVRDWVSADLPPRGLPPSDTMIVLLPLVASSTDPPRLSAEHIGAQILADLPTRDYLEVQPAFYTDALSDFTRLLGVIGQGTAGREDWPDLLLHVTIGLTDRQLVMTAVLLRDGGVDGTVRETYPFEHPDRLLIEVFPRIAEDVAEMVEGGLTERDRQLRRGGS